MSRVPSSEKLIFTRKTKRHAQCVRVDWLPDDTSVVWTSLFYWLGSPEIWDTIIAKIATAYISEGSVVYARLTPFDSDERRRMRKDPIVSRVNLTGASTSKRMVGISTITSRSFFTQLFGKEIPGIYRRYHLGSTIGRRSFIVSSGQIPNWRPLVSELSGSMLRKDSLEKVALLLFNHYEHGFEIIGRTISPDPLLNIAKDVSTSYNLQLQVQETGNPFGDP